MVYEISESIVCAYTKKNRVSTPFENSSDEIRRGLVELDNYDSFLTVFRGVPPLLFGAG